MEGGIYGEESLIFDKTRFIDFLSSWMQEVRHLSTPEKKQSYVNDLLESIPKTDAIYPDVKWVEAREEACEPKVQFVERYAWFHAQKTSDGLTADMAGTATQLKV